MNAFDKILRILLLSLTFGLQGCPSGSSDPNDTPPDEVPATPEAVFIRGVLIGMTGASISLTLESSRTGGTNREFIHVDENGPFAFRGALPEGTAWEVVLRSSSSCNTNTTRGCIDTDSRQLCRINGSPAGIASVANPTSVLVICEDYYRVGGTVTGLEGSGLVLFETHRELHKTVNGNGPFSSDIFVEGDMYEFSIETQPTDPEQECVVYGGAGVVGNADITDVEVECGTSTIGGRVTGLTGSGLRLGLSAEIEEEGRMVFDFEMLPISENGEFEFDARIPTGRAYEVRVFEQPTDPDQECTVRNGSGIISGDVTDVEIRCPGPIREYRYDNNQTNNLSYEHDASPTALKSGRHTEGTLYDEFKFESGPAVPLGETLGLGNTSFFQTLVDRPGGDGAVYSNDSGFTYWLLAESPLGIIDATADGQLLHRQTTKLRTTWRFRKNTSSASFRLEISRANMLGFVDVGRRAACCNMIGRAEIQVHAHRIAEIGPGPDPEIVLDAPFFDAGGMIQLRASANTASNNDFVHTIWHKDVVMPQDITNEVWTEADFTMIVSEGVTVQDSATLSLNGSKFVDVDLSDIRVGEEVVIISDAMAWAHNGYTVEGGTAVFFRDPAEADPGDPEGGVTVVDVSGLTMLPLDEIEFYDTVSGGGSSPPACDSSTTERSVLEFDAAEYRVSENGMTLDDVRIVRSGSSNGLVTARVSLAGVTATDGVDFVAGESEVRFGDGSVAPRMLQLSIIDDDIIEPDETFVATLHDPAGCAEVGPQSTAIITIEDDDTPLGDVDDYSIGGTVTGLEGSGLVLTNLSTNHLAVAADGTFAFERNYATGVRYEVRVASQPTGPGQFCSASNGSGIVVDSDVTNIEVSCETLSSGDGQLDSGFGSDGRVTAGVPGGANDVALQPDGKILVVGNSTLSRYNADGDLDMGFGTGGIVTVEVYGASDRLQAVAVQTDGQIVVAGYSRDGVTSPVQEDFVLARYDASGSLDLNFGTGGIAVTDFESRGDAAYDLLIQPDGAIVATGSASIVDQFGLAGADFAAVRYTSAGTLDAGFGLDGRVSTDVAGRTDLGYAAALQPDGKILLAGRVANSGGDDPDIGLVRYHPDGSLDTTFGNDGVLRDLTGEWDEAADVIVQPDGRVVVVGYTFSGGVFLLTIARYNSDGSADAQFGSNGRVTDAIMEVGRSIALQLDGSMIVAGRRAGNFAIARIDTEGNPDPSFGTNGVIEVDFFGGADEAKAVVIQADGKILVAGSAVNGTATELGLVRILP